MSKATYQPYGIRRHRFIKYIAWLMAAGASLLLASGFAWISWMTHSAALRTYHEVDVIIRDGHVSAGGRRSSTFKPVLIGQDVADDKFYEIDLGTDPIYDHGLATTIKDSVPLGTRMTIHTAGQSRVLGGRVMSRGFVHQPDSTISRNQSMIFGILSMMSAMASVCSLYAAYRLRLARGQSD